MDTRRSGSFQRDAQPHQRGASIVRHSFDPDKPVSEESRKRLIELSSQPDEDIRTDLIPEMPPETWQNARRNPYRMVLKPVSQQKAS